MYETELFAYLGLLAWIYIFHSHTRHTSLKIILIGLALLAVVLNPILR